VDSAIGRYKSFQILFKKGQPLRYVARSRTDPSKIYFTIWFEIIEKKHFDGNAVSEDYELVIPTKAVEADTASS
jgi:hypothetical protein